MDLSAESKKDVIEFQGLQQQLQFVVVQKQQSSLQSMELAKALEEVEASKGQVYRFAGPVVVQKDKALLVEELKKEKEAIELRQAALSKQEEKMKERFNALRKKLEATLGKGG